MLLYLSVLRYLTTYRNCYWWLFIRASLTFWIFSSCSSCDCRLNHCHFWPCSLLKNDSLSGITAECCWREIYSQSASASSSSSSSSLLGRVSWKNKSWFNFFRSRKLRWIIFRCKTTFRYLYKNFLWTYFSFQKLSLKLVTLIIAIIFSICSSVSRSSLKN